jgi:outer membrane protein OmpA-like peptidoglycan-associated protein
MVSAALPALAAAPARAQLYPGQDVIVNPAAIPAAQAFGPGAYGKIVLKPPHRHRQHRAVAATPTDTATADVAPLPDTTAPPPPKKPRHHAAPAQEATANPSSADVGAPFSLGQDEPLGAPTTKVAKAEAPPVQPARPDRTASSQASAAAPPRILFVPNSTAPQPSQLEGIKLLASDFNSALASGATQIQLQAFAGSPGDKSSDARRVSLKRALAIRQLLIDDGVPAARIVTRAMGGITDSGPRDRVDFFVVGG